MKIHPFRLILFCCVFLSCQGGSKEKSDSGAEKATTATTNTDSAADNTTAGEKTGHITEIPETTAEKEMAIIDTIFQNETTAAATTPGRYIFISDKGNQFEFTVAGEEDAPNEEFEGDADNRACDNTYFDGSNRAKVKTNAARAELSSDVDAKKLFESLNRSSQMESLIFPADSREIIEQRNVEFKRVYIYGFSRQRDEDYHLVMGTGPTPGTSYFFNAEISAPPKEVNSVGRKRIIKARNDFEAWFKIVDQCRTGYGNNDWRKNPVEVLIKGSLFYDKQHAGAVHNLGPQKWPGIKIGSAWEIHPITEIVFYR